MLSKKFIRIEDYTPEDSLNPTIFEIETREELMQALELCSLHKHSVRGVSLSSTLLLESNVTSWPLTHFSVVLDSLEHLEDVKKICGSKKYFFELRAARSIISEDFLHSLESVQRLIVRISCEQDLADFDHLCAELIAHRQFPLFEGAPMCRVGVRHSREFYHQFSVGAKGKECSGCAFASRCAYRGGFQVDPLQDEEAVLFIQHENLTSRF